VYAWCSSIGIFKQNCYVELKNLLSVAPIVNNRLVRHMHIMWQRLCLSDNGGWIGAATSSFTNANPKKNPIRAQNMFDG